MEARRCIDSSDVSEYRIPRHRLFYTNHFKNHFKILKQNGILSIPLSLKLLKTYQPFSVMVSVEFLNTNQSNFDGKSM